MEIVQINPMGACIAGIAAIGAFALVCFVWRHRIRNAAVAVLAAALALATISKPDRRSNGRACSPSAPQEAVGIPHSRISTIAYFHNCIFTNSLPFYVPEIQYYWLSDIICTTNGTVEVAAAREAFESYCATNLTLLASPRYEDRTLWGPLAEIAFAAGSTSATHTASMPVFPGFASAFFALADAAADSDGDGIADWREAMVYGTDPNNPDTDGDGTPDAEELLQGTNPLEYGDSPQQSPYEVSSNSIPWNVCAWSLAPGAFALCGIPANSNLFERTITVDRTSPWQQLFVSSRPDGPGGWSAGDIAVELRLDGPGYVDYDTVLPGEGVRVRIGTNEVDTVTLTLRATGPNPFLDRPLYLLRWTADIELDASNTTARASALLNGGVQKVLAARRAESGRFELPFTFDFSTLPLRDGVSGSSLPDEHDMDFQLRLPPDPSLRVEHLEFIGDLPDIFGSMRFVADEPSTALLPPAGTNGPARVFFYELDVEWPDSVEAGPRASQFDAPYPLNSAALRSALHDAKGGIPGCSVAVSIRPHDPDVRLGLGLAAPALVESLDLSAPGVAVPFFRGIPDWDGRFALTDSPPERFPAWATPGDDALASSASPDECGCADEEDGPSFGSPLGFRVSLGEPGEGLRSGFLWTSLDGTQGVTPESFGILAASPVASTTNGVGFTVTCLAPGGRTLSVTNIAHGAAVAVFNASGREECRWEVWNPSGAASQVRVRRVTVAGSFTLDETYDLAAGNVVMVDPSSRVRGIESDDAVTRVDSLTGVRTRISKWRMDGANPDFVTDELDETFAPDGTPVASQWREFGMVGAGDAAVRRETRRGGSDMEGSVEESRTWTCDASNRLRHGLPRSVRSSRRSWALYDYDSLGRETVRMEQLDGSPFPNGLDVPSLWADLSPHSAAKVTLTFYDPPDGDSAHPNDWSLPRRRETYVRQMLYEHGISPVGVDAPVLVSEETWTYTRGQDADGVPVRRCVHAKGLDEEVRTDEMVAYPDDAAVPRHLRGLAVSSTDCDGITTTNEYALAGGMLTTTTRRFGPASLPAQPAQSPTYTVSVTDAAHRLPLRDETRLAADGAVLEWSERAYDDIRRLRSIRHSDGTWETNAYSCCRLLWSRGRDGRKTLRSARTGSDMLYHADEDVWMLDVLGSPLSRSWGEAFRVTRHFSDAFGRETNTTSFVACEPGEGTLPPGPEDDVGDFLESVEYPGGSSSQRIALDGRGRKELSWTCRHDDYEYIDAYAGPAEELSDPTDPYGLHVHNTQTFSWRGGRTESHDGGGGLEWLESNRGTRWDDDGLRADVDMCWIDHYGQGEFAVTNSVTVHDALGRVAAVETPLGVTSNFYDGASSRLLRSVTTSSAGGRAFMTGGPVVCTVEYLYDELGERVGSVQDGVTNRTEVAYAFDEGAYWRVTTRSVVGPSTNSVTTTREQLTGLSDALRSRTISVGADGVATTNVVSYDSETMVETSVTSSPASGTRVARGVCGLVLEEETADETIAHIYDPHGREERTDRRAHGEADFRTVAEFFYSPMGDLVERRTYTNETAYVTERFAYDHEGREVTSTNALGGVVTTSYDPRGSVVAVDGAAYPLRMEYDLKGRRTSLKTTRDGENWDETRWTLDPATGLCLSKTYADNSMVYYTYTPDGLPARTTWPDGRWNELVYDGERNVVGMMRSDDTPGIVLVCDAYGETTNAVDTVGNAWRYVYGDNSALLCETNVLAGGRLSPAAGQGDLFIPSTSVVTRALDGQGRPAGHSLAVDGVAKGGIGYAYDEEGRVASISATNSADRIFLVSYLHGNGHVNGYEIELPGGGVFRRSVVRDSYRRELVVSCSSLFGAGTLDSYAYGYNSAGWPLLRNNDSFVYNARGEVTRSEIGGDVFTHEYDGIGNHTLWGDNAVTNEYTHNSLNQMTSSRQFSVSSVAPCEMTYSHNGGLASDGTWLYAYDAEDRLVSVTSASLTNGALRVESAYDWRDRRISKTVSRYDSTAEEWNVVERRAFTYDDWNLVHETVMDVGGAAPAAMEMQYFWGLDLSETLQGAGGVGGLLAVSMNGSFHFPCYDSNGNVTKYVDESGTVVASYAYDDFGRIISQSGSLADAFPHRFSTKYFDAETGLSYYGRRFYLPLLKRWLNRDPMGEKGCENLFLHSCNNLVSNVDYLGLKIFVIKHIPGEVPPGGWPDYTVHACLAVTIYNSPKYDVSEVKCPDGKIRFKVDVNPPNSFVDIYFRSPRDFYLRMDYENDHVSVARRHEQAIQDFKKAVETIHDTPSAARAEKEKEENILKQKTQRLKRINDAYDAPGGKHVLQPVQKPKKQKPRTQK